MKKLLLSGLIAFGLISTIASSITGESCNIQCPTGFKQQVFAGLCRCIPIEPSPSEIPSKSSKAPSSAFSPSKDTTILKPAPPSCKPQICFNPDYIWENCTCILNPLVQECREKCPKDTIAQFRFGQCSCLEKPCNIRCRYPEFILEEGECNCIPNPSYSAPSCQPQICFNPKYIWDSEKCTCVPPPITEPSSIDCDPSWQHFDVNLGKCVCPDIMDCPIGSDWDDYYCGCSTPSRPSCDYKCDDEFTCECIDPSEPTPCDPNQVTCPEDFIFDELLCECVKNPLPICDEGFHYDNTSCACECNNKRDCDGYFYWDDKICDCVCPGGEVCDPGFCFDESLCGCVCEPFECEDGYFFNTDTCSCACVQNVACALGQTWDDMTCQCVEDRTPQCDPGFHYDEEQCKCICDFTPICENSQLFDDNICKCVCTRNLDCQGLFLNLNTCECESI